MSHPLRLAFAGTPDFAARHLAALIDSPHELVAVLTQPDRRAGRGKKATASPVKTLALDKGLPVLQPASLRDPAAIAEVAALELDAFIVVAYGLILPPDILALPKHGCLNVHGSLLPRWRGAAPIQRAIEAGDDESGITIMQMDAGLDTGPMLALGPCPVPPLATSGDLYERLAFTGPALLLEVLEDLPAALARARSQDEALATYAAKIDKAEAEITWDQAANMLARRIRAFNPAPGCFTYVDGQRLKVWNAQPEPATTNVAPGMIMDANASGIAVRCGEGALRLQTLQLPGSKAMAAEDILRGRSELFQPGTVLGQPPPP